MADKKDRKLTLPEKIVSYPARVALLGGKAAEVAADQAIYNSGLADKKNPKFLDSSRKGTGYRDAKKLGRVAIGLDSMDDVADGKKRGGSVKAKKMASGGKVRGDGCAQRGKTKGRFV